MKKLTPLFDKIIVKEVDKETVTKQGIILPSSSSNGMVKEGLVLSVGPGIRHQDGFIIPVSVKVGDKVYFMKNYAVEFENTWVVKDEHIIGIITE